MPVPEVITTVDLTSSTSPIATENWYIGDVTCVTKSIDKHALIELMNFDEKLAYMKTQFDSSYNYIPEVDDRIVSWGFSRPGYEASSARDRTDIQTQESLNISLGISVNNSTKTYYLLQNSLSPIKTLSKIVPSTNTLNSDLTCASTSVIINMTDRSNYSDSGYVRINDEIIKYSQIAQTSSSTYGLYGIYRSCFCTSDVLSHQAGSIVQPFTIDYKNTSVTYGDSEYMYSSQSNFLNLNL